MLVLLAVLHHILEMRYITRPEFVAYANVPIQTLLKSNYPLVLLLFPIGYAINYVVSNSYLNLPSGVPLVAIAVVFDLAVLTSIAFFWYFVVVEIEKRNHGSSLIRFSSQPLEIVKAVVLIAAGIGAVVLACWDARRLLLLGQLYGRMLYWSDMINAIVGGLFLLAWAAVLITISVKDIKLVLRRNQKSLSES